MPQVIYADVLFCLNLFVNYFLLLASAKLIGLEVSRLRLCLGGLVGAAASFIIFLPEMNVILTVLIKAVISLIIVFSAFGYGSKKQLLKAFGAFLGISFAFAGGMMLMLNLVRPKGLIMGNSVPYVNITPVSIILVTVLCYTALSIIGRLTKHKLPKELKCSITVEIEGRSVKFEGITDTGNSLREVFSDFPVIVADYAAVERLFPEFLKEGFRGVTHVDVKNWKGNYRVIPYSTVSGKGVLPAFKPDLITVDCSNRHIKKKDVYIAVSSEKVSENGFCALVNPEIVAN
ncbi:MAG: sigma-E processing peptidase SpoIIGA [Oscillospiraceae bacterium]|nr:sigma-E processing peptidase SpoIIGA [Oscillospiraceae bacterium]